MYNQSSSPVVRNVAFLDNQALYEGGGMYNGMRSSPTLTDVVFNGNDVTSGYGNGGGGMYCWRLCSPTLTRVSFIDNSVPASSRGGGLYAWSECSLTLTDVSFTGNSADSGAALRLYDRSSAVLRGATFTQNTSLTGALYASGTSTVTIADAVFHGNSATTGYGGAIRIIDSSATIVNSVFTNNSAGNPSALFSGGGAVCSESSTLTCTNVSFAGNVTSAYGGALYSASGASSVLTNCILWGNSATQAGSQIYNSGSGACTVSYSIVQGGWTGAGSQNLDENPLFMDAPIGDLHLQIGSPAIDTGTSAGAPATDLDGVARPQDGNGSGTTEVDMGAFEYLQAHIAPTVQAGNDRSIDEGSALFLGPATFTDPDTSDTHTATIDWGDGTPAENGRVTESTGSGSVSGSHVYGDDGTFIVTVTVTDDDDKVGSDTLTITVRNVAPRAMVDMDAAMTLERGPFFLSQVGLHLGLSVHLTDPGSDDLTFVFPGGGFYTYYNNGHSPDPFPSPGGTYPVNLTLTAFSIHDLPGIYLDSVSCGDDDGGLGGDSVIVAVRGTETEAGDAAAWLGRFSPIGAAGSAASLGAQAVMATPAAELEGYLSLVRWFSDYLGTDTFIHRTLGLPSIAGAAAILEAYETGGAEEQLAALLLAGWLNFASGARQWGELVDTNGDGRPDLAYCLAMDKAEQVLCKRDASPDELEEALAYLRCCFAPARPEEPEGPADEQTFSDVSATHSYHTAIESMAARGVITGFADGSFRPDEPVSRQQFAKMIIRALGLDTTGETCPFGDVAESLDAGDPSYPRAYVAVCAAAGITKGLTAGTFAPYADITRQQLITMIARAAGLQAAPEPFVPPFGLQQFSLREHYENARDAADAGLLDALVGLGATYDLLLPASRGECAQLLWNLVQLGEG